MVIYSILAFICSLLYSISSVLCKYGLQHNIDVRSLSPKKLASFLAGNKVWLFGVFLAVIANISMIQIQSKMDVSIVYSLLNFSYIFVLVLGHYFLHEHLNQEQWTGVGVVILGTFFILSIEDNTTGHPTNLDNIFQLTGATFIVIAALISMAWRYKQLNYEILYAICTGICFGCVETYLKATTNMVTLETGSFSIFSKQNVIDFVSIWPFYVMFVYGALGWLFLQITYSHGNVSITVPIVAVTQRIVSMFSGYFVYDEFFGLVKILGVLTIILGIFMLVFSTLRIEEPTTV